LWLLLAASCPSYRRKYRLETVRYALRSGTSQPEAAINQIVSELLCSLNTVRPSGTPDTIEIHFIDCLIY
jgi:hypothetical protein